MRRKKYLTEKWNYKANILNILKFTVAVTVYVFITNFFINF